MNNSYIKLYRGLLDWEWYKDTNTKVLFIHLLLNANFTKGRFQGIEVERGQLITGRESLAESTGLGQQSIRTSLNKLKSTNEITIKSTSKFSVITIVKYDEYQSYDKKSTIKLTSKSTNNKPTTNQQLTTIEEGNNNKNVYREFNHLKLTQVEFDRLIKDGYIKNQIDLYLDKIQNYKKNTSYVSLNLTLRDWMRKDGLIPAKIETLEERALRLAGK